MEAQVHGDERMQNGVSGFKIRGSWREVVEHGDRVTRALRQAGVDQGPTAKAFQAWEAWRPRLGEDIDEEIRQRTAEQASVSHGEGEQAGNGVRDDLAEAGHAFGQALDRLNRRGLEEALDRLGVSLDHALRAADSAGRKTMRAAERAVYEGVMTRLAPYYFDNELVSANLQRVSNGDEPAFEFEININDEALKQAVARHLEQPGSSAGADRAGREA